MKVIHIPFCFYPDPVGGTEVYVESLARRLQKRGVQTIVCAPAQQDASYGHEGLPVRRFSVSKTIADLSDLYAEGDPQAAFAFSHILEEERPHVVHLHAFTYGVSLRLVQETKRRGIPVVFTYHTPTVSCQRGTLIRWGKEACDGTLNLDLCSRCTLHGLGLPRGLADVVGRAPVAIGNALGMIHLSGGVWTALRMRELVAARHKAVRALMTEADHIVALCKWVQDLLVRNDVPPEKITLSRQGLAQEVDREVRIQKGDSQSSVHDLYSPLRMIFLGRLDPTKGPHVLIQAIRMSPHLSVSLDIYGVVQGEDSAVYLQGLQKLVGNDPRIVFHTAVSADKVVECLRGYDLLAVPSQWLETGPMVILEAFAAGIPVLGSRLGGIAELVEHGVNGLLVEPASVEAWRRELQKLCEDRGLLVRLSTAIRPPRTMATVAEEMMKLYEKLSVS